MEWIVTTARTVEEAQTRALDLLGVDLDDAEIQVIEEGKTGLFGRTKTEARVRARIKPKAPPVKDERRQGRNDGRNRNRNRNRGGRSGGGGQKQGNRNNNRGGNDRSNDRGSDKGKGGNSGGNRGGGAPAAAAAAGGAAKGGDSGSGGGGNRNRNRNRNNNRGGRGGNGGGDKGRTDEDRIEMPVAEQRETLEAFVSGVATTFDSSATVELVEEGTTLLAKVNGEDLGRLIGQKANTLQTLEELARTAMHRAAAGRRYHRIQVDVDDYRARRREALARFATELAESVAASGESKAMEPMGAADRKLVHDAVGQVAGVETISEGRDPRRYIVIMPLAGSDEEE